MNPAELKFYPFIINLIKCTGSCNVLSPKICAAKEAKYLNVKAFNMITNKIKTKGMIEHISYNSKCKFNSTVCNSNQEWINKTYQCECKSYLTCKRDYSWNRSTCICENLKSILLT